MIMRCEIAIVPMELEHIPDVVNIHCNVFKNFFLTSFGNKFLQLMYEGFLKCEDNTCSLIAYDINNNKVVGFVSGILNPHKFYRSMLKHCWYNLGKEVIKVVIYNPIIGVFVVKKILKRTIGASNYRKQGSELASIAVDVDYQGRKIGKALVEEFLNYMKIKGASCIYLTTDTIDNENANQFYIKNGWIIFDTYIDCNERKMNVYIKNL